MAQQRTDSIETGTSWLVAVLATAIITITFGAPYVSVVALKPIALELGSARSVPSLASALAFLGTGAGGIFMGWWADRVGVRVTVLIGAVMVGSGAMVASIGGALPLLVGHGLLIGLLGNSGIFAPLTTYISRWFDRNRGSALSLVTTGQSVAGALWPPLFAIAIERFGWHRTLLWYGVLTVAAVVPMAFLLHRAPPPPPAGGGGGERPGDATVLGLPANLALALLCAAIVCCCVAMAMPIGHLVAFCSDLGYQPARGSEMLSLLLGSAFLSRLFWGRLSDRIGGLRPCC